MAMSDRIWEARQAIGMTQKQLAIAVGKSTSIVSAWEVGIKSPSRKTLLQLADVLMISPDVLLRDTEGAGQGVWVTDPQQLQLLRRFSRMSPGKQKNLLELLGVTADPSEDVQDDGHPPKGN